MNTIQKFTISAIIASLFIAVVFSDVQAAELKLSSPDLNLETGQEFQVDLVLNTQDESINAIEGKINFLSENLQLKKIQNGNSVVNFWMENPQADAAGNISFSGITPGGINSKSALIFSLIFETVKGGPVELKINNAQALLNDGEGTAANLSFSPININISDNVNASKPVAIKVADILPPENFNLEISQDKHIFDNRHFIVFATQDKGSGIAGYQVREAHYKLLAFLKPWQNAESPYLLRDQGLKSYIFVKAVDLDGNQKIEITKPQIPLFGQENYLIYAIIILSVVAFVLWIMFKKRKKITR